MQTGMMPMLLERVQDVFHPVEARGGSPVAAMAGRLPYVKELSGHPRFCGSVMGVDVLWDFDVLEKQGMKPCDPDYTAEYLLAGRKVRVLGRHHRYLDYPVNVFLNVCMVYEGILEIVDFCINLLAQVAPVNWSAFHLPREMHFTPLGGKDSYHFDREAGRIMLNMPTATYKKLPIAITRGSGAVGRVTFDLVPGETFFQG